jgi:hypothetical protein
VEGGVAGLINMATSSLCAIADASAPEVDVEEIRSMDIEFYGDPDISTETLSPDNVGDEEGEYLSPGEDEADVNNSILHVSVPNGTPNSVPEDGELAEVRSKFENKCGCNDSCYDQFTVSEVKDYRLSMRELEKHKRNLFIITF